jgi:hypothetical protein
VVAPTVIAIDWSGAKQNPKGIRLAAVEAGRVTESRPLATREDAIELVVARSGAVFAGFDFSFGLPAWFAQELNCATVDEVWDVVAKEGERWLGPPPTPPFWNARCDLAPDRRFRACERRYPTAKSVFQLVGNGQVGAGSVRGMPLLRELRAAGFAIWPFDPVGERTVFEIYPTALRRLVPDAGPFANEHERDAVCSALALWRARETVAALPAATYPITRLEGDVLATDGDT